MSQDAREETQRYDTPGYDTQVVRTGARRDIITPEVTAAASEPASPAAVETFTAAPRVPALPALHQPSTPPLTPTQPVNYDGFTPHPSQDYEEEPSKNGRKALFTDRASSRTRNADYEKHPTKTHSRSQSL